MTLVLIFIKKLGIYAIKPQHLNMELFLIPLNHGDIYGFIETR